MSISNEHADLAESKLKAAQGNIRLFGLDYDGTISDASHKQAEVFALAKKILDKDVSLAFITARAATAVKVLVPPLQDLMKISGSSVRNFVAGGNGAVLYEVTSGGLIEQYNHGLETANVSQIVEIAERVYQECGISEQDLSTSGLETFRKFLADNWVGYIPPEIYDLCKNSNGRFFTEQAKVTFVLPQEAARHQDLIEKINSALGDRYQAVAGDKTFLHITKKIGEDGKKTAVEKIIELLSVDQSQVATFGDMPTGNDAGLLSFPFSFTNDSSYAELKRDNDQPPYILMSDQLSPVERVYKAIENIINI